MATAKSVLLGALSMPTTPPAATKTIKHSPIIKIHGHTVPLKGETVALQEK